MLAQLQQFSPTNSCNMFQLKRVILLHVSSAHVSNTWHSMPIHSQYWVLKFLTPKTVQELCARKSDTLRIVFSITVTTTSKKNSIYSQTELHIILTVYIRRCLFCHITTVYCNSSTKYSLNIRKCYFLHWTSVIRVQ